MNSLYFNDYSPQLFFDALITNTGASHTFLTTKAPLTNKRIAEIPFAALLPNSGHYMQSTHTATLNLPNNLPPGACEAHIFTELASGSLVFISQLCDSGCIDTFERDTIKIFHQDKIILIGYCNFTTGLYCISACGSPHPLPECCRNSDPNLQEPFLCHVACLGLTPSSHSINVTNYSLKLTSLLTFFEALVSIRNSPLKLNYTWGLRLQPNSIRISRYTSTRLAHLKPTQRGMWSTHTVAGWYLGPVLHHYCCYRVWIPETSAERIAETLAWFPTKINMPLSSSSDSHSMIFLSTLSSILLQPLPFFHHPSTANMRTSSSLPAYSPMPLVPQLLTPSPPPNLRQASNLYLQLLRNLRGCPHCTHSSPNATSEGAYSTNSIYSYATYRQL
jgi:hypothetical protein